MSEEASTQPPVQSSAPAVSAPTIADAVVDSKVEETKITNGAIVNGDGDQVATDATAPVEEPASITATPAENIANKPNTADNVTQETLSTTEEDIEMKDADAAHDSAPAAAKSAEPTEPTSETPASSAKPKAPRRKSGVPEHKGKKLNKKASAARLTHTDAKPGDYFYVRLKGFPPWPAIVCDEEMLPNTLVKSRPVTAARPDGTYRADYEDGGPKVKDRTFPVMYLHTNEFGWIANYNLMDLDFNDVGTVTNHMKKDLAAARQLAAEQHDLEYFREILKEFMENKEADRAAKEIAKEAARAEKKAKKAATPKKEKKTPKTVTDEDGEEDVEMADAAEEPESDNAEAQPESAKTKKRKAEDTPQRTESVKKPRQTIKLTTTPKTTNGTATPKSTKEAAPKSAKSAKPKKAGKSTETPEVVAPKEPELSAEEKRAKKEKEILFLRHKLQKGLLTRDQNPKEEEMKSMSEFVTKLEGYADLEVSIIRATKINKVLKAILKLPTIPKEEEFKFKSRSQSLLDKWNKLLASEQEPGTATAATNGTGAGLKAGSEDAKASPDEGTNGTKESSTDEKTEEKSDEKPSKEEPISASAAEVKDVPTKPDNVPAPSTEESAKESTSEPITAVESAA